MICVTDMVVTAVRSFRRFSVTLVATLLTMVSNCILNAPYLCCTYYVHREAPEIRKSARAA